MGDMADYYSEMNLEPYKRTKKLYYVDLYLKELWRTKDGREIPLSEMEDEHVLSCFQYAERHQSHWIWKLWLPKFKAELERRGI